MQAVRILVVEDEAIVAQDIAHGLKRFGYEVPAIAGAGEEALAQAQETRPDLVLMDIQLRGAMDGIEAARQIRERLDIPVVFLTGHADVNTLQRARLAKPFGYLLKPVDEKDLYTAVEVALTRHESERESHRAARQALRETEESLKLLVQSVKGLAIFALDPYGRVATWNAGAERIKGYRAEEIIGRHFSVFYPPEAAVQRQPQKALRAAASDGQCQEEGWRVRRNGSRLWSEVSLTALRDEANALRGFAVVERDVTERKRAEEEIHFLETTTCAINAADNLQAALNAVLRKVCEVTGWRLGQAWMPRACDMRLECCPAWHCTVSGLETFRAASRELDFTLGNGLISRAWLTRQPVWMRDVTEERDFGRRAAAQAVGLKTGVAIPVLADEQPVAVIEFFAPEPREADERFVKLISAVAAQLGTLIQRKQAEEQLRQSERRFRQLAENIREVLYISELQNSRLLYISPAYEEVWGRSCQSLYEQPLSFLDAIHPEDRARAAAAVERQLRGEGTEVEYRIVRPDGSVRWIWDRGFPIVDAAGNVLRVTGIAEDITARKRAEEELRSSEERYRLLFESNPMPMWVFDKETLRFLAVNEATVQHYGYSREEFLAMTLKDIRPPEDIRALLRALESTGKRRYESGEWRHRKKDGTIIHVEISSHELMFNDRAARLVLAHDITARKRAQAQAAALANLGQRLSLATTQKEAASIIAEVADTLCGWDACVFQAYLPEQDLLHSILNVDIINGEKVDVPLVNPFVKPTARARKVLKEGGQLVLREAPVAMPADAIPFGDTTRPSASFMLVPISHGKKVIGLISIQSYAPGAYTPADLDALQVLADHCAGAFERIQTQEKITRLNAELEQRVRERTAALETSNRELEAFCYSISHDLRAPLRSINGFCQVLLRDCSEQLNAEATDCLHRVCEAGQRMSHLIEDLLHLSRVTRAEMHRQGIDLRPMARAIINELRQGDARRRVRLTLGRKLTVRGDARLMRIALENLISNAWKFTGNRRQARLELGALQQDGQPTYFVRDNGAGFDMAYADKLFGVFQRLHSPEEFPGTGIGLAIVQRIIHRHGGRIWAKGKPNRGATFYFTVPD